MGCGIYKIENLVNKKIYIGSSVNVNKRLNHHKSALKGNYHDNRYLQNSFNKYCEDNFVFELIEECDPNDLVSKENNHIDVFKSNNLDFGYNLALVNDDRRNVFSDATKIKMSKTKMLNNNNFEKFKLINIKTNNEYEFDNLFEAANYFIYNGFTTSKNQKIRDLLSKALRGVVINNGGNGSVRKTIYKHKFEIIKNSYVV